MKSFRCPCGNTIAVNIHRGILINTIATLGAHIVQARDHVLVLRSKRHSKQFKEQHARDTKLLAEIEARLPSMEGTWYGMRFFEREFYG